MRTNSISQNHVEFRDSTPHVFNMLVVFSYGKPIVASITSQGKTSIIGNSDFYGYSVTTSKHVNSSLPELRTSKPGTFLKDDDFTLENLYKLAGVK
jgi:hypothetical protein